MTVDELHRLLIAPEIIVVDIADAAVVALGRAIRVQHPNLGNGASVDDCDVRRRAAVVLRAAARLDHALRGYRTAVDAVVDDYASDNLPF